MMMKLNAAMLSEPSPASYAGEGRVGAERSEGAAEAGSAVSSLRSAPTPTLPRLRRERGHEAYHANLMTFTASKSTTSPPTRLVA